MRVASDVDPPSDASDPSSTTREEPEKQFEYEIALGSSGWLFVYYVGVVKAMRELGMARCVESSRVFASSRARDGTVAPRAMGAPRGATRRHSGLTVGDSPSRVRLRSKTKVYGTSGGALSGALLFMDCDPDALAQYVYICAARARRSVLGAFQLRAYCRGAMTEFCDPKAHELLSGRFEVSITRIFPSWKNLRISDFPTYNFLIQALLCSACIVPLSGLPIWLRGFGLCLDGAVTDMQVLQGFKKHGTFSKLHCKETNPNIVIVNPFYSSRADIKPSRYIPIWWCFYPPEPYKLKQLFEMGYADAYDWYGRTHGPAKETASRATDEKLKEMTDSGKPSRSWATDCQEWASQSAETAARRAAAAAETARRAAAKHAEEFGSVMKHEAELVSRMSFKATEVASAAARSVSEMKKDQHSFAERADAAAHATLDAFVVVGQGTIIPFRLVLKTAACLLVYAELIIQAIIAFFGAMIACFFPGKVGQQGSELWRRCRTFTQPLPRVLLQAIPGVYVEAKINERTAKQLGELSALYRVLCYLVHMEIREFDVFKRRLSHGALDALVETS